MSEDFDPYHVWLGIPPDEQPPNHYRLLGLRLLESDGDVISNALDQRLAFLRTLQAGKRGSLSQKLLNEVSAAGAVLLERKKKSEYDERLKKTEPAIPSPSSVPAKSPQPAAATQTAAPRKPALPTAKAIAPAAPVAAVVPLPEPILPMPVATVSRASQPISSYAPAAVVPSPNFAVTTVPAATTAPPTRRSGTGAALAIATVAACVIVLAAMVGGVIWYSQRKPEPSIAKVPSVQPSPPTPDPLVPSQLPPEFTPIPSTPTSPTETSSTTPATTPPQSPVTPAPAENDPRQVWVYADNSRGGFRRMNGGNWVELGETTTIWYKQSRATTDSIELSHLGGTELVTLKADRLVRNNQQLTGPTVFFGKWRSLDGLPPFARRDPGDIRPLMPPSRNAIHYGLLFDGQSQLDLPLPTELETAGRPFTIELMVRWLDPRIHACLLECGDLRLSSTTVGDNAPMLVLESGGQKLQIGIPFRPEITLHPTIVCDGTNVQIAINGSPFPVKLPVPSLGRGPILVGRDASGKEGLRGLIRGLRISEYERLATLRPPTAIPRSLTADDLTLLAIDMQPTADSKLLAVGTSGGEGKRTGALWVPMDSQNRLAAERSPERIDLLKSFLGNQHILLGSMVHSVNELEIKSAKGRTALQLPYLPPARYRLEANVARTGGQGGLVLGLMLDDQPALLLVDAFAEGRRATGLLTSGRRLLAGNPSGVVPAELNSSTQSVVCEVTTQQGQAQVRVLIGGNLVCEWQGEIAAAPLPEDWPLKGRTMFIGSIDATFKVTSLTLTGLSSSGPLAASPRPPTTAPSPMPPTPTPVAKKPPPDAATLTAELDKARGIYAERLTKAKRPDQKSSVAADILKDGNTTDGDATARYVLIDLARKIFIQAGAAREALDAATLLESEYVLPPDELTIVTLEALDDATLVAEQRAHLATAAIDLAEELVDEERFEPAGKLAVLAVQAANRQGDADLKKDVLQRKTQVARIAAGWEAAQASLKTLMEQPDDPAANLVVGKFRCLVLEDWKSGTAHLAKSGAELAAAATLDLAAAQGTAPQAVAAAEAWLKLAADAKAGDRDERDAMQRRAKSLLEGAVPQLSGLDKVKAEKQLETLKGVKSAAPRTARTSKTPSNLTIYNTHNWRFGNFRTKECNVYLIRNGKPVTEFLRVPLNWDRESNPPTTIPLKNLLFDAIRIELLSWEMEGAGLAEVQLIVDGKNRLAGAAARASGIYNPSRPAECTPAMVTDGVIDENKDGRDGTGYWLLRPRTIGWIEIAVPK